MFSPLRPLGHLATMLGRDEHFLYPYNQSYDIDLLFFKKNFVSFNQF